MKVPLLDLKAQYAAIRDEIRPAIDAVCDSQYFILGPEVSALEEAAAAYCGTDHAVGVSSGTDALIAALMAAGVKRGDAVITSPYTFFASVGSIVRVGAVPVFADIDPVSYNIDPARVRELLENWPPQFAHLRPRALMPVHLFGQCVDMDPLLDLAHSHNLVVVEDAAQAIGAEYPSARGPVQAGAMGEYGCFSFFPSKNLGAFGDGGLVTTRDAARAALLRQVRVHGMEPKYYHKFVGGNFRLDALQAAVLRVKLPHLDAWHAARRRNAGRYNRLFEGTAVRTPREVYAEAGLKHPHIYNQYVVRVPQRDTVRDRLRAADVGCEVYYPVPLHLQECFADLGHGHGDFPESEKAAEETLALPVYPELTAEMQEHVAQCVLNALA